MKDERPRIDVAIPTSFTTNLSSNMQRSFAVSLVARSAAIYGVDRIFIYPDPLNQDRTVYKDVITLLRYLITPPYLKKVIFSRDRSLSYAGALPPVKLELFREKVAIKDLEYPEYRVGLLVGRSGGGGYLYEVGLDKPVLVRDSKPPRIALIEIIKNSEKYLIGRVLDMDEASDLDLYQGFKVSRLKESLPTFLDRYEGLKIGLSRTGDYIGDIDPRELRSRAVDVGRLLLVLGAPEYGLNEILGHYDVDPRNVFDYYINLVHRQRVETIRMEEALLIALAIFDYILGSGRL